MVIKILKWFERGRINKLHEQALLVDRHRDRLIKARSKLKVEISEMTSTHCPIIGRGSCQEACIHFYGGYVNSTEWCSDYYVMYNPPKCKLWSE